MQQLTVGGSEGGDGRKGSERRLRDNRMGHTPHVVAWKWQACRTLGLLRRIDKVHIVGSRSCAVSSICSCASVRVCGFHCFSHWSCAYFEELEEVAVLSLIGCPAEQRPAAPVVLHPTIHVRALIHRRTTVYDTKSWRWMSGRAAVRCVCTVVQCVVQFKAASSDEVQRWSCAHIKRRRD